MEIGIPPKVTFPMIRNPSPVEDGDVGHKGSFYQRRSRKHQQETPEPTDNQQSSTQNSAQSIDIHV